MLPVVLFFPIFCASINKYYATIANMVIYISCPTETNENFLHVKYGLKTQGNCLSYL